MPIDTVDLFGLLLERYQGGVPPSQAASLSSDPSLRVGGTTSLDWHVEANFPAEGEGVISDSTNFSYSVRFPMTLKGKLRMAILYDPAAGAEASFTNGIFAHELNHVNIDTRNWDAMVAEVNPLEHSYCIKKCAELSVIYAQAADKYYRAVTDVENCAYDVASYPPRAESLAKSNQDEALKTLNAWKPVYERAKKQFQEMKCQGK